MHLEEVTVHRLYSLLCRQALRSFAQNMSSGLALPLVAQNKSASVTDGLHKHCKFTLDLSVETNAAGSDREEQQRSSLPAAAFEGSAEASPGGASRRLRQVSLQPMVGHKGVQMWDCELQGVGPLTFCWACHRAPISQVGWPCL